MPARQSAPDPRSAAGMDWKQMASPHGYDQAEFSPGQSPRDYKRIKAHGPDEERLRLRSADEALEGPQSAPGVDGPWDSESDGLPTGGRSRLYRE